MDYRNNKISTNELLYEEDNSSTARNGLASPATIADHERRKAEFYRKFKLLEESDSRRKDELAECHNDRACVQEFFFEKYDNSSEDSGDSYWLSEEDVSNLPDLDCFDARNYPSISGESKSGHHEILDIRHSDKREILRFRKQFRLELQDSARLYQRKKD